MHLLIISAVGTLVSNPPLPSSVRQSCERRTSKTCTSAGSTAHKPPNQGGRTASMETHFSRKYAFWRVVRDVFAIGERTYARFNLQLLLTRRNTKLSQNSTSDFSAELVLSTMNLAYVFSSRAPSSKLLDRIYSIEYAKSLKMKHVSVVIPRNATKNRRASKRATRGGECALAMCKALLTAQ